MSVSHPSAKFLRAPRHALDLKFHKEVQKKINALLNGKIIDDNGNVIGRWLYTDGNVALQFKSSSGGGQLYIAGEWDPAAAYPDVSKGSQAIVFFTSDGQAAGTYYNLRPVAPGMSPDTGFPNWAAFPNAIPGQWL